MPRLDQVTRVRITAVQLDPELDAENAEFDFSNAHRPGRNELYERAQGHFHEVSDAEDQRRLAARPDRSPRP
jgi:hypothetical protein